MLVLLVVALTTGCTSTNASDPDAVPVTNETPVVTTPSVSQIVQGRVTDGTGTPVSEAIVIAEGPGAPEMAAITNEKGEYFWDLPEGTFTLTVTKDGFSSQSTTIALTVGQTLVQDFVLTPAP